MNCQFTLLILVVLKTCELNDIILLNLKDIMHFCHKRANPMSVQNKAFVALRKSLCCYSPISDDTWQAFMAICKFRPLKKPNLLYNIGNIPCSMEERAGPLNLIISALSLYICSAVCIMALFAMYSSSLKPTLYPAPNLI